MLVNEKMMIISLMSRVAYKKGAILFMRANYA